MPLRFTVLASGSAGNASLIESDGFGLLVDIGLGPRLLAGRLTAVGASWRRVHAVVLTHTHGDHWNERTLAHLRRLRIPFYCHAEHRAALQCYSPEFMALAQADLVRIYEAERELALGSTLRCRPIPLRHDGGATFGFRVEGSPDLFGQPCAIAYAADLGSWSPALAAALADVEMLALEFNHDVELEYASGRSPHLINRVLGDAGHLSNDQAAALLQEVLRRSAPGRRQYLVQLHLSRDCNRRGLALQAARAALVGHPTPLEIRTAHQDRPSNTLVLGAGTANGRRSQARNSRAPRADRPITVPRCWLPGLEM
jgi:hypothetical protein